MNAGLLSESSALAKTRPDHMPHPKLSSQKIFKENLSPFLPFPVLTGDLKWSCYPPGLASTLTKEHSHTGMQVTLSSLERAGPGSKLAGPYQPGAGGNRDGDTQTAPG